MTRIEKGPGWELRLGRWQDVLADVAQVDSVITDPPYSERTHAGHNAMEQQTRDLTGQSTRTAIVYGAMDSDAVQRLVKWTSSVSSGWQCFMTSHDLGSAFEKSMSEAGRYVFPPLPIVQKRPRLVGDGPSTWCVWMVVSRPRNTEFSRWGCLPGLYEGPTVKNSGMAGAKPVGMMRSIVRDYSRPGDLVCDPYAGSGTTLLAAVMEGRRAIGAEMDEGRFDMAVRRLRAGFTTDLFGGA